jgi:cysteine-rich repeat protein
VLLAALACIFVMQFVWIVFLLPVGYHPVGVSTTQATDGNITLCFNTPPQINQTANVSVAIGQSVIIQVNASDPNPGTVLSFSDNTTLFNITSAGIINFTTNISMVGNHTIRITVTDDSGCANAASAMEFVIEVISKIPSIFNERNGTVTDTSAAILWDTDVLANSSVIFGVNATFLNGSFSSPAFVINHSLVLSGLQPNTTYFYNVSSCNAVGCNQTGTFNFTTAVTPPAPVCGNFITEPPEECDDGNTLDDDGCDFACRIEEPIAGGGAGGCADGLLFCYDWSPCDPGGRQYRLCTWALFTCGQENRTEIRRCIYTPPPPLPRPPPEIIVPPIVPPVAVPISVAAICQFLDTLLPLLIALFALMTLAAAKRKKQQKPPKREEKVRITLGLLIIAAFLASVLFCGTTIIMLLMMLLMALLFFAYRTARKQKKSPGA